jgi:hypothetical protein
VRRMLIPRNLYLRINLNDSKAAHDSRIRNHWRTPKVQYYSMIV